MAIKYVAFDLDDTLFNGTLLVEKARRASIDMMIDLGLPVDREYVYETLHQIVGQFGSNNESHFDNLLIRLKNDPNCDIGEININKYVTAGIMGYHREKVKHFKLFRDVEKTLKKIKALGIKTAIITDGIPKKQWEKILRLKLDKMVDMILISDEESVRKPDPFLFKVFLNRVQCKPEEVIYVGERPDKDIKPAKEAGLHTILVHRGTKHDPYITKKQFPEDCEPDYHANDLYVIIDVIKGIEKGKKPD